MKISFRCFPLSLVILSLALGGCATLPTESGGVIGTLRVSGPEVRLDGAAGRDGDSVRLGSSVVTGAGSSARVEFRDGGYLQLDQNTDPFFEWLEQSKCILIRIIRGQAYLKRERACVQGPNLSLVLSSELNLRVDDRSAFAEITLVRGRAELTEPAPMTLAPAQQLAISGRRVASLRTLSPADLRSLTAWRNLYRFAPLPAPETESPVIFFPSRPRPSSPAEPAEPAQPQPPPSDTGGKPTTTLPGVERGIRVTPDMIEMKPEPVIR